MSEAEAGGPGGVVAALSRSRLLRGIGLWCSYLLATAVATWPHPATLWSRAPSGDAAVLSWNFWWVKDSLLELRNPYWTDQIFAPAGSYLTLHGLELAPALVFSPLTLLAGPTIAYSVAVYVLLATSGFLFYRLGRRLGLSPAPSWVGGVLFCVSPFLVHRSGGHFSFVVLACLIPATLLGAMRVVREQSAAWAVATGAGVGIGFLCDGLVGTYLSLVLIAFAVVALLRYGHLRRWRSLRLVGTTLVAAAVVAAPQLIMSVRASSSDTYEATEVANAQSAVLYNVDVAQLGLPALGTRVFGDDYQRASDALGITNRQIPDGVTTLGWATTALALAGVLLWWRSRRLVRWLGASVVVCVVLSLGPVLRVFGHEFTPLSGSYAGFRVSELLPGTWLLHIPVLQDLRIPQRWLALASVPLCLLAAFGSAAIIKRWRAIGPAVVGALVILNVIEASVQREGRTRPEAALSKIIKSDRSGSLVLDLPLGWQSGIGAVGPLVASRAMLEATEHEHPIAAGYISRYGTNRIAALQAIPLYRAVLDAQDGKDVLPTSGQLESARTIGVGWIVLWPEASPKLRSLVNGLGLERVARTGSGTELYRVGSTTTAARRDQATSGTSTSPPES